jgi:two-component system, sensor histidine kinase and response regulator
MPRPKILSIDDREGNLLAMQALLEPLDLEVVSAASGQEALALARRNEFAVILLDVMMPEMDGFEVLERLRAMEPSWLTPVILVTARNTELAEVRRAYTLGAVDFVSKPVAVEVLQAKVRVFVTLWQAYQELRERDAALAIKDRHIAVLAHDLATPLNTLALATRSLLRSPADERAGRTLDRVRRSVERMTTMVRDLLDFARAGRGSMPIRRATMDLGSLCQEMIEDLESAEDQPVIELTTTGDLVGEWDRVRLQQALSNLIGNAVRYGRGRLSVAIRGNDPAQVEVSVYNDGPPVPEALLSVIFEPFERGNAGGAGLGLGLYIVKMIATAHGGDVSITSAADVGTTVVLRLPRA